MSHRAPMVLWALLLLLAVAQIAFAKTKVAPVDEDIQLSKAYGGPGGIAFSDMQFIVLGQKLSSITLRGAKRVDAITTRVAKPSNATWDHGGSGGGEATLVLEEDEYVNAMEIHWAKKKGSTRIFFVNLTTSEGNYVSAGVKTALSDTVTAPKGFHLSGFFGRAAGEINQLGVIWTRIAAKPALLTDSMGTDWYGKKIRNWVGPTIGTPRDTACYRQTKPFSHNKNCPLGYEKGKTNCLAQCPLAYPVSCFLECIPQNDDCALEIAQKAVAALAVIVNVATAGMLGAIVTMYQGVKREFYCAANVVGVVRSLVYYLRFQQTTAPQGTVEEMAAILYQSDVVLVDLPVAICHCLGLPVSTTMVFTGVVMMIVEAIVKQVIVNGDVILSSAQNVYQLLNNATLVNSTTTSVSELQELLDSNSTCGYQLKRLTDYVTFVVNKIRNEDPNATVDDVRVKVSKSSLVLTDIPSATNQCMSELLEKKTQNTAFENRDLIRTTFSVIVDQLIESATTNMGFFVAGSQYILQSTNYALVMFAGLDPTRIVWLASQFVQPTCGPTTLLGEIDDGPLHDALGLTTIDEAFVGSYGTWNKKGDGVVNLVFTSLDTEDVTVVIHSNGESIARVKVKAGKTVTWNSTVKELCEKTMYLDRWRPGLLGVPGLGGGSLKLWIPSSSQGGHLTMHVRINVS